MKPRTPLAGHPERTSYPRFGSILQAPDDAAAKALVRASAPFLKQRYATKSAHRDLWVTVVYTGVYEIFSPSLADHAEHFGRPAWSKEAIADEGISVIFDIHTKRPTKFVGATNREVPMPDTPSIEFLEQLRKLSMQKDLDELLVEFPGWKAKQRKYSPVIGWSTVQKYPEDVVYPESLSAEDRLRKRSKVAPAKEAADKTEDEKEEETRIMLRRSNRGHPMSFRQRVMDSPR
jgi:hypothetical protein